jgi:hypothetical protein
MGIEMRFPRIDVNLYLNLIRQMDTVQRVVCCYCGKENVAAGNMWVCFHCELLNNYTVLSLKLNDTQLMNTLMLVNDKISDNDYDGAISEYKTLLDRYNEPEYTYNYGLLHIQYSNHEISLIGYDKKGFMEENAALRVKGSALASRAKLILNRASSECQKGMKTGLGSILLDYVYFITNIKLGKAKIARRAIGMMAGYNAPFVNNYCEMVFNAETGRYAETAYCAAALLKKGSFSVNALYYAAWAMFKTGRGRDALRIINALGNQVQNSSILALAEAIEKSLEP